MKKLVLIANDFNIPEHAMQYALSIASHVGATLYGLFVHSRSDIDFERNDPQAVPLVQEDKTVAAFAARCKSANVPFEMATIREHHLDALVDQSAFSDLMICDADSSPATYSISSFLANAQCPVLLINKSFRQIDNIVLTYEDKISGIYAIKHFSYLFSSYREVPAYFVSVVHENVSGLAYDDLIRQWLPLHYPNASIQILKGTIRDELPRFINELSNPLVVMGAFGRTALSRFFQESLASVVLRTTDAPVFVAHT